MKTKIIIFIICYIFIVPFTSPSANKTNSKTEKKLKQAKKIINDKLGGITVAKNDKVIYFAYGSNMLHQRLQKRVSSAIPLGIATLDDYNLVWHKKSKDGSTKCSIAKGNDNDEVYGVLYEFDPSQKSALDKAEGLGYGYEEADVEVLYKGKNITAKTYYATDIIEKILPYDWYKAFVIAGAQLNNLPNEYLEDLKEYPSTQDPNKERRTDNYEILTGY